MHIVVCTPGYRPDPWVEAFAKAMPEASIIAWTDDDPVMADYAIVWGPSARLFETQPKLKAVFNLGAGVDALLRLATLPRNLPVIRLGDAGMSVQMAEYVCQAVTRFARDLPQAEKNLAEGIWTQRMPRPRNEYPVGVMGLGAIGERVARALSNFEYPTLGWSRTAKSIEGVTTYCADAGLDAFLRATRILVCALPLTPQTTGLVCRATLEKLKPGGYLINVGRGAHLIEEDLVALIDSGHLSGATLDVFQTEPLPRDHAFLKRPSITVTPHISAVTIRDDSVAQIADKLRRLERGEVIEGVVQRDRGY